LIDSRIEKLERYRAIVRRIVEDYASGKPSNGQIETEAIMDDAKGHYEVMHVGWDGERRVHGSVIHLDIRDGKIWLQYDGTNRPVADELEAAGVPREDIVLAFHPARIRPLTGYGMG
jgi:hypothetical protein